MKAIRKILIVDDETYIVEFLQSVLKKYGYETITGKNGQEALTLSRKHKPDLILMDITMPVMDGLEASRIIKSEKISNFIPIILLSGKRSPDDKIKGLDVGADDYLTKPFEIKELITRVRSMLRIKQLTEQLEKAQLALIEAKQVAAVGAVAVTVNHKINTPLTSILINVDILGTKLSNSSLKKCSKNLNAIMGAAKEIGRLTKKLANLSKPNFVDYMPGTSMIDLESDE